MQFQVDRMELKRKLYSCTFVFVLLITSLANAQTPATRPPGSVPEQPGDYPEPTLKIGDKAPGLAVEKWVKGGPVKQFEPGKFYVVEFWATWCGPCRAAMPHLSEIAHQYKDKVTVIGFNVLELSAGKDSTADYITKVTNFVKNLGDGMDYNVAIDVREGTTHKNWMAAAGIGGIPSSFIIDDKGKIAWIGHPLVLDEALKLVISGEMTPDKGKKLWMAFREKQQGLRQKETEMKELEKNGETDKALAIAELLIEEAAMGKPMFITAKYNLLKKQNAGKQTDFIKDVMKKYQNDPLTLQEVARALANSEDKTDRQLALKIMKQAIARFAPDDLYAYSTLANIYFMNGENKLAVSTQEYVIKLLEDESMVTQRPEVKDKAKEDLLKYKAAAE
jgi:thiol-disulfide isomerase/thioredoxin